MLPPRANSFLLEGTPFQKGLGVQEVTKVVSLVRYLLFQVIINDKYPKILNMFSILFIPRHTIVAEYYGFTLDVCPSLVCFRMTT